MLLGHRRALHTLPPSTLQQKQQKQKQEQQHKQQQHCCWQQEAVFTAELDVAGLPVPQHDCCLLPGELFSLLLLQG